MNYEQLEERSQQLEARVAILEKELEQMKQLLFYSMFPQQKIPRSSKNDPLSGIKFFSEQVWRKYPRDLQPVWGKPAEEETVVDTTLAKWQQLPEPLLQEVNNFGYFIILKHLTKAAKSQPNQQLFNAWLQSEPFLEQISDFIDFITQKHLAKTAESQTEEKLVEVKQETQPKLKRGNLSRLRGIAKSSAATDDPDSKDDYVSYLTEKYK